MEEQLAAVKNALGIPRASLPQSLILSWRDWPLAPLDIVIITNSPGELSSWVRATVKTLRRRAPDARIVVMLVPCPFASGGEARIAASFEQVDVVVPPSRFFQVSLGWNVPGYTPSRLGVVVFLGGDFWHALLVAARLRYPTIAYGACGYRWGRYFGRTCVTDAAALERMVGPGYPVSAVSKWSATSSPKRPSPL